MAEVVERSTVESNARVRASSLGLVVGKRLESTEPVGELT